MLNVSIKLYFHLFLVLASLVLVGLIVQKTVQKQQREITILIYVVGLLMFPIVWDYVIGYEYLNVAFLWVYFVGILQLIDAYKLDNADNNTKQTDAVALVQSNSNVLLTITFAIGTLFLATSQSQKNEYYRRAVQVLTYALILVLMFIVPVTTIMDSYHTYVFAIYRVQKVLMDYAIALFIASLLFIIRAFEV